MRTTPGSPLPAIDVRLVNGKSAGARWTIADEKPATFVLLAIYRGIFCSICRVWLGEMDKLVAEFDKRGVPIVALSCDGEEGARKAVKDWGLERLRVGYGLEVETARAAGLYISEGRGVNPANGEKEPRLFSEPGLLLARPDGTLYAAWIQSMPYARVHVAEVLTAIDNFVARDMPLPRGSA